ncbi:MAG: V-type ATP synthase subunit D [Simkaniaceae bacterium]|nr:V-type ATP synthase subunit D [Simkaniaceae bacterium]
MSRVKLTKNELRSRQYRLRQLRKYLPTLQLKKAMLQIEVNQAMIEAENLSRAFEEVRGGVAHFRSLLGDRDAVSLFVGAEVRSVAKKYENIAGAEIPLFEEVLFREADYSLFDTPLWIDDALIALRSLVTVREQCKVASEKQAVLAKELREVAIRVNLFEKVLIPRTERDIKKIKIFLGDQELSSVAQAKVTKNKIIRRKMMEEQEAVS